MKVAILMLSYERYDTLRQTLSANLENAGCPVELYVWDNGSKDRRVIQLLEDNAVFGHFNGENVGIAAALNQLLRTAYDRGHTHFQLMANDILEPQGWISRKLEAYDRIPGSGLVSISPGPHNYAPACANGLWHHPGDVIGQFMLTREVYEKVGAFREDFGPYGPIDNDYNVRCLKAGFVNYYLRGMEAIHLDDRDNTLYGYDKAAMVRETWPVYQQSIGDSNFYFPPGEYTLNIKENVQ